jgi:hypothetical protein
MRLVILAVYLVPSAVGEILGRYQGLVSPDAWSRRLKQLAVPS